MESYRRSPTSIVPRFPDGSTVKVDRREVIIVKLIASDWKTRVYRAVECNEDRILKELLPGNNPDECSRHEALSGHPNIVRHITHLRGNHDGHRRLLLLMEYAPFGDLRDAVREFGPLRRQEAWNFFSQIVSALGYMHRKGYAHGAVHPRNVFVFGSDLCKLGDFGNGGWVYDDPRHKYHKIAPIESTDLQGAADTLLFCLIGCWPPPSFWERFMEIENEADAHWLLVDCGLKAVISVDELMYIRAFYDLRFTNRPIPEVYGPLRSSMECDYD